MFEVKDKNFEYLQMAGLFIILAIAIYFGGFWLTLSIIILTMGLYNGWVNHRLLSVLQSIVIVSLICYFAEFSLLYIGILIIVPILLLLFLMVWC